MTPSIAGDPQTSELLLRLEGGDRSAFDDLFAIYRPALRSFIRARLGHRLGARLDQSDVVQEVLLDVYLRLGDYLDRRPMPFRTWLWQTAYERLLKVRRHHGRARRAVDREADWPDNSSELVVRSLLGSAASPSRHLEQQEVAQRARQALDRLAEADREILFLRTVEALPHEEIACLLGIEPSAARQRYGRALLRLRKLLIAQGLLETGT
jgi:RNA polymerase sigma-70 factor (ECF subfamily)